MKNITKGHIYIIFSAAFCIFMFTFYGVRFFHFKNKDKNIIETVTNLNQLLTAKISYEGDGIRKDNSFYYFNGKYVNNYVEYSNRLFRILNIDNLGNIKMVLETPETILSYNGTNYDESLVSKWLNTVFYPSLDQELLTEGDYCVDQVDNDISCNSILKYKVGLLSLVDYKTAGNKESFLNNGYYTWLINNDSKNNPWYINNLGEVGISNTVNSLSVRPVVTLNANIDIISGLGTKESPYRFKEYKATSLEEVLTGSYIKLGEDLYRVSSTTDNIKLIKETSLDKKMVFSTYMNIYEPTRRGSLAHYLNNEYYNSLSYKKYIVSTNYNTGIYINNYQEINSKLIKTNIGLPTPGDAFIIDSNSYFTLNPTGKATQAMNIILPEGRIYTEEINTELNIKPVITVAKSHKITAGTGTSLDPFVLE